MRQIFLHTGNTTRFSVAPCMEYGLHQCMEWNLLSFNVQSHIVIFTLLMFSTSETACLGHSIDHEFTQNLIILILAYEYEYKELNYETFQSYTLHRLYLFHKVF